MFVSCFDMVFVKHASKLKRSWYMNCYEICYHFRLPCHSNLIRSVYHICFLYISIQEDQDAVGEIP